MTTGTSRHVQWSSKHRSVFSTIYLSVVHRHSFTTPTTQSGIMRRNHWAKSFTRGETTHLQLSCSTEDTASQCGVYIHSVIFHYWWKKSSENGSVTFFFVLQHFALKPQQMYVQENQSSGRHDDVVFPNPVHTADSRVSVRAAAVRMWSGVSPRSIL